MSLKTAFLSLILLICPLAFCYGQVSFLGVNGERGYSAMRGIYVWNLDNNFIFTPSYEFYRQSDEDEIKRTGSTYRYGLLGSYDFSDQWRTYARVLWQPLAVGNRAVSYYAGGVWYPFYRWGVVKDPFFDVHFGQARYRTYVNTSGTALAEVYKQIETNTQLTAGAEVGPWNLKASWHKVIQYSNHIQPDISFSWVDIPFMTAVVQGFLREAAALRVSYPTSFITPYAQMVRYQYAAVSRPAAAVGVGLEMKWGDTSFTGGVEVFEPRREDSRRTFFSMSVEVDF